MVWKCTKSPEDIELLHPGEYVMGDINTLGWAVIKSYEFSGEELVKYVKEMNTTTSQTKIIKCHSIQQTGNDMQYPHFIASGPYQELFDTAVNPRRLMKCQLNQSIHIFNKLPMLSALFDFLMVYAMKHVKFNTIIDAQYVCTGKNLLANDGAIREQYIHTDYKVLYNVKPLTPIEMDKEKTEKDSESWWKIM